jgi:Cu/Ag efflux protein CusF
MDARRLRHRWVSRTPIVVATWFVICSIACGSQPQQRNETSPAAGPASQADSSRFDLKGKVVSVDKAGKRLTVDHEAIPGFMSAMTMAYPVKDDRALDSVAAGDEITAKVVSTGSSYWLEDITVNSHGSAK